MAFIATRMQSVATVMGRALTEEALRVVTCIESYSSGFGMGEDDLFGEGEI